jgi:hypothetical protein
MTDRLQQSPLNASPSQRTFAVRWEEQLAASDDRTGLPGNGPPGSVHGPCFCQNFEQQGSSHDDEGCLDDDRKPVPPRLAPTLNENAARVGNPVPKGAQHFKSKPKAEATHQRDQERQPEHCHRDATVVQIGRGQIYRSLAHAGARRQAAGFKAGASSRTPKGRWARFLFIVNSGGLFLKTSALSLPILTCLIMCNQEATVPNHQGPARI